MPRLGLKTAKLDGEAIEVRISIRPCVRHGNWSHRTYDAGFCFFVKPSKLRKSHEELRKIEKLTPGMRFDEYSKPRNEKFVLFTKNPVCGYIIFIFANRNFYFSCVELICDFSWIFRGPRNIFVFFVSSKILRGPGFVAFIF